MRPIFLIWPVGLVFCLVLSAASAENWPGFRGPTGQGISSETGLPLRWSQTENVAWRTEIPGLGWSSPIVYGNRVFLTTVTDAGTSCRALCLDRRTGRILWNTEVCKQTPKHKEPHNSYATPTPAADEQRVYVVFGDGTVGALNHDGQVQWTNQTVRFYSQHGLGASPRLYGDLVIMPFDGSSEGPDKTVGWKSPWDQAVILGMEKKSGEIRWRASRGKSRIAHVTPNLVDAGGRKQLVSGAGDVVQGFDPDTGERLWSIYSKGEGVVPSIVAGGGLVFTSSGFEDPTIRAVRTDGRGDVTSTHIAWEVKKAVPNIPSFVYANDLLFSVSDAGVAMCLEPATGQAVWQERLGGKYAASPVFAEDRIYFLSDEGEAAVIEAGRTFKLLARNSLGEKCQASPAVSDGQFFIRTEGRLYCIGASAKRQP